MKCLDYLADIDAMLECTTTERLFSAWNSYINRYPLLATKLRDKIRKDGIAHETLMSNVFLPLLAKISRIETAREVALATIKTIEYKLASYPIDDLQLVLYIGNGNGAGWYTEYDGKPSILIGMENVLILGWDKKEQMTCLLAHEIGHYVDDRYRVDQEEISGDKGNHALEMLYKEGYAQYFESIVLGDNRFWELEEDNEGVSEFVTNNLSEICAEYLDRARSNKPVKDFYGSWYSWRGFRQIGYYLGYLFMVHLLKEFSLEDIAKMDRAKYQKCAMQFLYQNQETTRKT